MLANAPQNASKSTTSLTLQSVKPAVHLLPGPAAPSSQEAGYTAIRSIWGPRAKSGWVSAGCSWAHLLSWTEQSWEGRALTV